MTTCGDLSGAYGAVAIGFDAPTYRRIDPQGTPHIAGIECMNPSTALSSMEFARNARNQCSTIPKYAKAANGTPRKITKTRTSNRWRGRRSIKVNISYVFYKTH